LIYDNKKAIILAIVCTIFTSAGQILWKMGLTGFSESNIWSLLNLPFILGFATYGLGAVLMLLAFKYGDLSLVYPFIAASYVWVLLLSWYLFGDTLNAWKWAGVVVIIVSVSLLGYGSSRAQKEENGVKPLEGELHG